MNDWQMLANEIKQKCNAKPHEQQEAGHILRVAFCLYLKGGNVETLINFDLGASSGASRFHSSLEFMCNGSKVFRASWNTCANEVNIVVLVDCIILCSKEKDRFFHCIAWCSIVR